MKQFNIRDGLGLVALRRAGPQGRLDFQPAIARHHAEGQGTENRFPSAGEGQ